MKKFYVPIFAAVFLLISFSSQGQVYNSISSNPSGYTLDDPRFWVGAPPPNPCTNCTIKIYSDVTMVQCCGLSSTATPVAATVFTSQTPSGNTFNDGQSLTLGMRFQSTVAGNITGARFFKTLAMGGTHTAVLYDNTGTTVLAGPTTFVGETASGWQTQNFPVPFLAAANTTYVIAVFYSDGNYTSDNNYFTTATTNNPLTALQDVQPGGPFNDVYVYSVAPAFPANSNGRSTNYWVDVNFSYTTDFPALNDVVLNTSTVNVYGNTTLTFSTYVELFNSSITIGNDPVSTENIILNDQVDLNGSSSVILANDLTTINATGVGVVHIAGPHTDFPAGNLHASPGLYAIIPPDANGFDYTWTLDVTGLGKSTAPYTPSGNPYYDLNCPPNTCGPGLVFGPATTTLDATYGLIFTESLPLPVVLVQFLATRNDDGSVKVSWATSQEENSNYYDVERSSDQSQWSSIGTVKAKGYSSITTNYFLNDKSPIIGTGYYRLKMVDLDGKFTYSRTIPVTTDDNSIPLVIYSNPFSDQIRLKINVSEAQNLLLTVSDMMGKTYISQSYQAQNGDNFVNLQPSIGSSGMYILRIQGNSYDRTVKLEKQ